MKDARERAAACACVLVIRAGYICDLLSQIIQGQRFDRRTFDVKSEQVLSTVLYLFVQCQMRRFIEKFNVQLLLLLAYGSVMVHILSV